AKTRLSNPNPVMSRMNISCPAGCQTAPACKYLMLRPFGTWAMAKASTALSLIDMTPFFHRGDTLARRQAAAAIGSACKDSGFFYVTGHRIAPELFARLDAVSRAFFALPEEQKLEIRMARGGRAWRGYFPVGGELTSGKPDVKEGIYFGSELGQDHPRVRDRLPLHGANLFPAQVPELKRAVLDYMDAATAAAHALLEGIALSLGLEDDYFRRNYPANPTILFRVF